MDASGRGIDFAPTEQGLMFPKLRPGPGLTSEQVVEHQRDRLQRALIELIAERGYDEVTVRSLACRAGVSTRSLYKQFVNVDDCLGVAYARVMDEALSQAEEALRLHDEWTPSLRAGIAGLFEFFATDPQGARLVLVDIYGGGTAARKHIAAAFGGLEGLLASGFAAAPRSLPIPRRLIAGMAAGLLRIARTTAMAGRSNELPSLVDQTVAWVGSLPDPDLLRLQARTTEAGLAGRRREAEPYPATEGDDPVPGDLSERGRLLRATTKLAAGGGFRNLTAPKIRAEAGVSRRCFEDLHADVRGCFLEAVGAVADSAARRAQSWAVGANGWERQTAKAILAMTAQAARDRGLSRLTFSEIYTAGRAGLIEREEIISRATFTLRSTIPPEQRPSSLVAEASVAAAWHIAALDAGTGRARNLPSVAPLLSYVVLAPIIGANTATAATMDAAA